AGSSNRPPSENESGVAFRMPTTTVWSRSRSPERVRRTVRPTAAAGEGAGVSGRGGRRASETTVPVPVLLDNLVDLGAVDDFALEERLRHLVQDLDVATEEQLRALVRLHQDAPHLAVDLHRGRLRVVHLLREVAAEEDLLLLLAEGHGTELLAHTPLAHHLAGELGGALDVVARPRGHVPQDELLGGTT